MSENRRRFYRSKPPPLPAHPSLPAAAAAGALGKQPGGPLIADWPLEIFVSIVWCDTARG